MTRSSSFMLRQRAACLLFCSCETHPPKVRPSVEVTPESSAARATKTTGPPMLVQIAPARNSPCEGAAWPTQIPPLPAAIAEESGGSTEYISTTDHSPPPSPSVPATQGAASAPSANNTNDNVCVCIKNPPARRTTSHHTRCIPVWLLDPDPIQ